MKLVTLTTLVTLSVAALSGCATDSYGKGNGYENRYGNSYGDAYGSEKQSTHAGAIRVVKKVSTAMGEVFATAQGMTLYTFTKDAESVLSTPMSFVRFLPI